MADKEYTRLKSRYTTGIIMAGIPFCPALRIRKTSLEFPNANMAAMRTKNLNLQSKCLRGSLGRSGGSAGGFFVSLMKKIIRRTAIAPGIIESQNTIL